MCWSAEVAGAFTVLELCLAVFLWRRNASKRDRLILPLAFSTTIIEALEVFIWLSDPQEFPGDGSTTCKPSNKIATSLAYFVLLGQPLFDGVFLSSAQTGVFTSFLWKMVYFVIAIGMFGAAGYAFIDAAFLQGETAVALSAATIGTADSLYSDHTCTYVGPGGHLLWQFRMLSLDVPDAIEVGYFVLSLAWFLYKPLNIGATFFLVFNALLVGNFVYFDGSKEAYSVWCWQALFIYAFFICEPYLFPNNSKGKQVTTLKAD